MLHIIIGTKAQLIKMAPVMVRLQQRQIPYNFIFTGQHKETIDHLRENFSLKSPDIILYEGPDITSIFRMLLWSVRIIFRTIFSSKKIFQNDRNGVALVHGDTFSTLLGALMGKVHGIRVAHIESGLRSFRLGHPFPEEITRLVTFWMSDLYFCPGEWAVRNLRSFKGTKIDTKFNTLLDSLELAQTSRLATVPLPTKPYCIVTLHRFENVYRKEVFIRNLDLIEIIAKHMRVVFILHPLTQKKLLQFNLFDRLSSNSNIELHKRYDYFRFVKIIIGSEFLVSDGGSNQEECFYLGKPCLLLRKATERQEGLGRTTVISHYDATTVEHFLSNYKNLIQSPLVGTLSPSEIIIEHCLKADGARTK